MFYHAIATLNKATLLIDMHNRASFSCLNCLSRRPVMITIFTFFHVNFAIFLIAISGFKGSAKLYV